ncbi:MAG TPA: low molecular weight protein-tyrosine-phosphatase [Acidimicrobiia bacterium]|nr:low molecular weight protein-tyrosine-phosphatase [Acidimicrobiia bacterium]
MTYRILTVCLGNICRSPAAEAVIRAKAAAAGLDVEVDSAGTGAYHIGESPHSQSVAAGRRRGYPVVGRARQLDTGDFERFDLILTMDESNLRNVRRLAPPDATRIEPIMSYGSTGVDEVPDPWGRPDSAYEHMYDLLEDAVDGLIRDLGGQSEGRRQNDTN